MNIPVVEEIQRQYLPGIGTDGYTCLGPISAGRVEEVIIALRSHDLHLDCDPDSPVSLSAMADGVKIEVSGLGARGFLLHQDGEESETEDLHAFLLLILDEGSSVTVHGWASDGLGGFIVTNARYRKTDGAIFTDMDQYHVRSTGEARRNFERREITEYDRRKALRIGESDNIIDFVGWMKRRADE